MDQAHTCGNLVTAPAWIAQLLKVPGNLDRALELPVGRGAETASVVTAP
jgi:hypothetical protein